MALLRGLARLAVAVGAAGSVALTLRAGRRSPRFLLVLFVIWVLLPFVALGWAAVASKRWAVPTQTTLYCVTLAITLVALTIYGRLALPPGASPRAFAFLVVPAASWLFMAIAVGTAAFVSRRLSHV